MRDFKSKFMTAKALTLTLAALESFGYSVKEQDGEKQAYDGKRNILRALPHSNGKTFIVAFDPEYLSNV